LAKIAVAAVADKFRSQVLARGDGWTVSDVVCRSGPDDRPFEEQHANFSIAVVAAGTFEYRSAAGRELMTPGSLMLGSAGQSFECGHEHGVGDRCIAFWYAPAYFERLAGISPPAVAARYNGITDSRRTAAVQRYLAENEPMHYSMLRTSVVPTILTAGFRMNVIPSQAEATIDIRMAPGEDQTAFFDQMQRVIGDPAVKVERLTDGERPPTPPSRLDTEMFRALETVSKRVYPGSVTLPTMLTGATDMAFLRAKGMQSYGIGSASSDADRTNFGAHSDVERLLESSLYTFVRFTWESVMEVSASK